MYLIIAILSSAGFSFLVIGSSCCMFSGKSTELIRRVRNYRQISKKILKVLNNSSEPLETREIELILKDYTRTKILYRLNSGGHVNLDLTGNIKDRTVAGTLDIAGRLDAQADIHVTGSAYVSENIQLDDNKYVGIDSDTDLMQLKANEVKVTGMLSASSDIWIGGDLVTVGNGTFGGYGTFVGGVYNVRYKMREKSTLSKTSLGNRNFWARLLVLAFGP